MAMKDFDAKQFLLERGERVGLGIALFLMIVLILYNLFIPPRGFFSGKPADKAAELAKPTELVRTGLRTNEPSVSDLPQTSTGPGDVLFRFEKVDPGKFEMLPLFPYESGATSQRRPPELLAMDEARVGVARVPVPTYIVTFDDAGRPDSIKVLVDAPEKTLVTGGKGGFDPLRAMQGRGGARGGPPMSVMLGGPGGMSPPGGSASMMGAQRQRLSNRARYRGGRYPGGTADDAPKEYKSEFVPLTKAEKGAHLAVQVRPLRMAIIAGSFPYKKQLEEFRDKLHLASLDDVLKEPSLEKAKGGVSLPAFRFLGVRAMRVTVDANGKELGKWEEIPLNETYKPFLFLTGKRFEPDDPKWKPISFPGLVMPRLPQMHDGHKGERLAADSPMPMKPGFGTTPPPSPAGGAPKKEAKERGGKEDQYPPVEDEITRLQPVLKQLRERDAPVAVAPAAFRSDDGGVDIFDTGGQQKVEDDKKKEDGATTAAPAAVADADIPSHCLVRVVDLTIEPGKIYKYKLQVRMANPNYKHKDVASPTYGRDQELKSDKWFEVPQKVVVPPELIYYAVNQAELDQAELDRTKSDPERSKDKDQLDPKLAMVKYWRKHPLQAPAFSRYRMAILQAHRWLETVPYQKGEDLLIGEWAVAERFVVSRGEYVGRRVRAKFPLWRDTLEDYLVASTYEKRRKVPGFPVSFGYDRPDGLEPLLVDFESEQTYQRSDSKKFTDVMAEEVLILSPDGKLLGLEGARDATNPEREERVSKVRERIQSIEEKGKPKDSKDPKKPGFGT